MDERMSRLNAHQQNIERYERLLQTDLNDLEQEFLKRRLSEERFAIAMLIGPLKGHDASRLHK
jgi:hypothetical protein